MTKANNLIMAVFRKLLLDISFAIVLRFIGLG